MFQFHSKKKLFNRQRADFSLGLTAFGLMGFGVVMIYSASVFVGERYFGDPRVFYNKQLISLVIALVVWVFIQQIDYHFWKKFAGIILLVSFFLLLLVFLFEPRGGSHSWIFIGSFQFQPSEFTKLALIIYLASWFDKRKSEIRSFKAGFIPFVTIMGVIAMLLLAQPDLGTFMIIFFIAVLLYFFAGAPLTHFALGGVLSAVAFWITVWQSDYRRARLLTFLDPSQDTLGSAYHIQNILIAIGSGGWWGIGFGQSRQKRLFLPEPHTDSIFPVIVEELGFVRALIVLLAILFVIIRAYRIALLAPDEFGKLLAIGIATWITVQTAVNIAAMLGLIPLTGIPIPFVSYGGSSLIMLGAALGILLNISKQIRKEN